MTQATIKSADILSHAKLQISIVSTRGKTRVFFDRINHDGGKQFMFHSRVSSARRLAQWILDNTEEVGGGG